MSLTLNQHANKFLNFIFVGIRKEEDHMGHTWRPKEEREGTRLSRSI